MNAWARVRHELAVVAVLTLLLLVMAMVSAPVASAAPEVQVQRTGEAQRNGAVDYISGGIGTDEADALKRQSADYPLTLEFASSRSVEGDREVGAYLADVNVDIRDAQGRQVLATRSEGPLLLVRLPPGAYTVVADWKGVRKQHTVDIAEGARRHVVLMW